MRKMILLAAMSAIAALMLAATPAFAQIIGEGRGGDGENDGKVAVCHKDDGQGNPRFTLFVNENAVDAHLAHGDTLGPCDGRDGNGDGNGDGRDNDRDFRDFCRIFDCRDNDNDVVPAFEITQDFEQEAESGDIDQSFDVSQTGDNSNQTVGIQGVANTGNAQNQIGVIDAGNFGNFDGNNNNHDEDFCDFFDCDNNNNHHDDEDFCDFFDCDNNNNHDEDFCDFFDCDNNNNHDEDFCDFFDCDNNDDGFFFVVDDFDGDGFSDSGSDFEFEDVGASIELSPTNTVTSDQQVNQAAAAFGVSK
jgi:hypothetical protein